MKTHYRIGWLRKSAKSSRMYPVYGLREGLISIEELDLNLGDEVLRSSLGASIRPLVVLISFII